MAGLKYRGLDPSTRILRWSLFVTLVGLVVGATGGQALDTVSGWLRDEYESLPWYVTRTTALLSYVALTGSVIYGLLLSTKILDAIAHRTVSFTLHQDLASIGVALALVHAAVLMIDRSVPHTPMEVLVPFTGPYLPLWVGIGQLTLIASVGLLLSFYARKRMGQRAWRRMHYVSFLAFLGATVHGLMAGTDTQAEWVFWGYLVMSAIVAFLLTYRVTIVLGERVGAQSGPTSHPAAGRTAGASRGSPPMPTTDGAVSASSET